MPIELCLTGPVAAGSLLRVQARDNASLMHWIADRVTLADGQACEVVFQYSIDQQRKQWGRLGQSMLIVRAPEALGAGDRVTVHTRFSELDQSATDAHIDQSMQPERPYFADLQWTFDLVQVDQPMADDGQVVAAPARVRFEPGEVQRLAAIWSADDQLTVRHYDHYDNRVRTDHAPAALTDMQGNKIQAFDPAGNIGRVRLTDRAGREAISNRRPRTNDGQLICFGDIHWHSELSCDGMRPLVDAMAAARDDLCLDFCGPGDHIWSEGRFGPGATPQMQVDVLRQFDDPGRFAVVPGAEYSAGCGHANFYCDDLDRYLQVCRLLPEAAQASRMNRTWEYVWDVLTALAEAHARHVLLVPHHTNTNSWECGAGVVKPDSGRPFWNAMTFPAGPELPHVRQFEIYQHRGCFESEQVDPAWRVYAGGYNAAARTALIRGYRFGFTGGTDNHQGWPTRRMHGGRIDGFTAVLADELTTQGIFSALYHRRSYATTGARIVCDVTMNGQPIGSELRLGPDQTPRMDIRIFGTAPLQRVEVISAGIVLDTIPVDGQQWDLQTTWTDARPGRPLTDVWYYLRLRQADGHCAWLSPFWVDAPK